MLSMRSLPQGGHDASARESMWDEHRRCAIGGGAVCGVMERLRSVTKACANGVYVLVSSETERETRRRDCAVFVSIFFCSRRWRSFEDAMATAWGESRHRHCRNADSWDDVRGDTPVIASNIATIA